jgi:LacI family transcriptional regulator, galactose operon repressor
VKPKAPATLKQIAALAGVHTSTVSRALDPEKRHLVADNVAQRVAKLARSLAYRPNRVATTLKTGRSRLIGVLLPDIANPVFAPILSGIAEALATDGYAPIVVDAGNDASRQFAFVENLLVQRVEGLILATVSSEDDVVAHCVRRGLPVVLVNRSEFHNRVSSVVSDDERGMLIAVDHLTSLGHRQIGHIAGPRNTSTGVLRKEGFAKAMARHGLKGPTEEAERFTRDCGLAPAQALIRKAKGLTAVVAANDLLALGVLDALHEMNLRCPDDISVVGHNDMPLVDLISPPLTTVRIEHRAMGREAAGLLLKELGARKTASSRLVLEPQLIVRGSTKAIATVATAGRRPSRV